MALRMLTFQVTEAEYDILEWIRQQTQQRSRSDTIRTLILEAGRHARGLRGTIQEAADERAHHPPRRYGKRSSER